MDTASPVIKGIHIRTFNYCVIFSACLLYGIIIYKTINISIEYNALIVSIGDTLNGFWGWEMG